jgi:hypothetical protein
VKFQAGAQHSIATPPVAEFDARAPLAPAFAIALACWPKNERQRGHALVTWAAQGFALNETYIADHLEQTIRSSVATAAMKSGVSAEELLKLPHAQAIVNQARQLTNEVEALLREQLFRPAGGWVSMANAAYQGGVDDAFQRASRSGGVAGRILLYCARLSRHHPELSASYNRAMHIIDYLHTKGLVFTISDRDRREAWAEWRGVSPLWAAIWLSSELAGKELGDMSDGLIGQGLLRTLGWAQWFRVFGVTHEVKSGRPPHLERRHRHSRRNRNAKPARYLLPDHEAVMLRVGVPAQEPPLLPLTGAELAAAQDYRAPV